MTTYIFVEDDTEEDGGHWMNRDDHPDTVHYGMNADSAMFAAATAWAVGDSDPLERAKLAAARAIEDGPTWAGNFEFKHRSW